MMDINELSSRMIGVAIEVHKALGPGLIESAYEECLCHKFGPALEFQCARYERGHSANSKRIKGIIHLKPMGLFTFRPLTGK